MLNPIGSKIAASDTINIAFRPSEGQNLGQDKVRGRWLVDSGVSGSASQWGKEVELDKSANKVSILGATFTYSSDATGNFLEWTIQDCEENSFKFSNLKGKKCSLP